MGNPDPCQANGGACLPGGCDNTALATVYPVDPSQCGSINIALACGGGGLCSAAGSVDISFHKPGPAGVGIDVDRGTAGDLASPITTLGTSIFTGMVPGDAPATAETLTDSVAFGGSLDYYLVSCDYTGPKAAGNQRINGAPAARFQNP